MIEPLTLDGITYTKRMINGIRDLMIINRDMALENNHFAIAITLSHNIALLNHLCENTEEIQ